MTEGAFLDRDQPPDRAALEAVLGERLGSWDGIAGWLEATYGTKPEPLFYGKDSGWVVRYRRSGKSLVTLLPGPGTLRAVVVIGPSVAADVAQLDIQPSTRAAFERAHAYPDGRWLDLPIETEADVADVRRLVELKSPPPRRPRTTAARRS
jgi:hypothetical protein